MTALTLEDLAQIELEEKLVHGANAGNAPVHQFSEPVVVTSSGLLSARFPPSAQLLSPWLLSQSLSMIFAPRGIGKTHVSLGIAHALGTAGEFLGWQAPDPVGVLFLDGEMPGSDLRHRWERIIASTGRADDAGMGRLPGRPTGAAGGRGLSRPALPAGRHGLEPGGLPPQACRAGPSPRPGAPAIGRHPLHLAGLLPQRCSTLARPLRLPLCRFHVPASCRRGVARADTPATTLNCDGAEPDEGTHCHAPG